MLIGETEASMRDKLSSLTLPDSDTFEQEGNINFPVTMVTKTTNKDESEEFEHNKCVAIETAISNTEDMVKCANTSNSPDTVSMVTEIPSVQDENSEDVMFQPTIINVVSAAAAENDSSDNVKVSLV